MKERGIIRQYLFLSFLSNAGGIQIISAIYVTFLMKNGLNLLETNLVNAVFFFTLFICEIPTGAFADIFGRKTSFVAACGLIAGSMLIYGNSHTLTGFICAEIIAAIGYTFRSGAFQAWLIDNLKHHGYEGPYTKIFARENMINQIGGGLSAILGSYLATHYLALPWLVGGTTMVLVMILAQLTMKEEYFVHKKISWRTGLSAMKNVATDSIHYGLKHQAVRFVLIITFVQIYAIQALNMYWQPFFRTHGIIDAHLGFVFTGIMAALATGAFLATRLTTTRYEKTWILRAQIYVGLMVIAAALVSDLPLFLTLFLLHEVGRGFWGPIKDSYLHQRIPSSERATISSFCAIAPHIGGAIGLVISGVIAQYAGIATAWIVAGSVLIFGALLVAQSGHKA